MNIYELIPNTETENKYQFYKIEGITKKIKTFNQNKTEIQKINEKYKN